MVRLVDMEYDTWYEVKRDCEKLVGTGLSNRIWLRVKPRAPLPWNDTDKAVVLSRIIRLLHLPRRKKLTVQ